MVHLRGEGKQAGRVGDEERRVRYKIEAREWGTQALKKSDVAHLSGIGRSDEEEETRTRYKIKVTERGIQAQKEQKEKCTCVCAGMGRMA